MRPGPFERQIEELLGTGQFVPFMIQLTNGDRFEIPRPHRLEMGGGSYIAVPDAGGSRRFCEEQIECVWTTRRGHRRA